MKIILFPLIFLLKAVYLSIVRICGSYGFSLLILSVVNSAVMLWLGSLISRYPKREALVQSLMVPKLSEINKEPDAALRHAQITELYRKYAYHPVLALRSAVPLLLQLPFLFAAYHALSNLGALQGQSFAVFQDLSKPDALLYGINLLPILMSLVNIVTALITPSFAKKDKIQAFIIAGLFLVLLYNVASALLIFWTMNNLMFFLKTLYQRTRLGGIHTNQANSCFARDIVKFIEKQLPFLKQFFSLLCLFYIYQSFALESGFVFKSYLKFIPFLVASLGFLALQAYDLSQLKITRPRHHLSYAIFGSLMTIAMLMLVYFLVFGKPQGVATYYIYNTVAYSLIFASFLVALLTSSENKTEKTGRLQRILLLIIASTIPAVHYANVNSEYLLGIFKPLFFIVIPLMALTNYWVLCKTASQDIEKDQIAFSAAIFTALFVFLPILRYSLRSRGCVLMKASNIDLDMWFLLFVFVYIGKYITDQRIKQLNKLLSIVLIVFIGSSIFVGIGTKSSDRQEKLDSTLLNISIKEKPNIYLFVYDGIPNQRVFRYQNMPFDELNQVFLDYEFKLYEDTYSLDTASLGSMSKMLDFRGSHIMDARDVYSGNSRINHILRNNGYKSRFLLGNYYTGYSAIQNKGLYDEMYPKRSSSNAQADFFMVLIRGIFEGNMRFDTKGLVEFEDVDDQAYKLEVIKECKENTFVVNHYYCPGHSQNSGQCLPNETELWLEKLAIAIEQMRKDFEAIQKYDPNSIVIAIGDHGPALTGDCHDLAAWKREEITEDLVWDRIGTMVAIKWPDLKRAEKYDSHIIVNQDVFPVVLSYLSDDKQYLTYCPDKTFTGFGKAIRKSIDFNKGKIILD